MMIPLIPTSPTKIICRHSYILVILRKDYIPVEVPLYKRSVFYVEDRLNKKWNAWHDAKGS